MKKVVIGGIEGRQLDLLAKALVDDARNGGTIKETQYVLRAAADELATMLDEPSLLHSFDFRVVLEDARGSGETIASATHMIDEVVNDLRLHLIRQISQGRMIQAYGPVNMPITPEKT